MNRMCVAATAVAWGLGVVGLAGCKSVQGDSALATGDDVLSADALAQCAGREGEEHLLCARSARVFATQYSESEPGQALELIGQLAREGDDGIEGVENALTDREEGDVMQSETLAVRVCREVERFATLDLRRMYALRARSKSARSPEFKMWRDLHDALDPSCVTFMSGNARDEWLRFVNGDPNLDQVLACQEKQSQSVEAWRQSSRSEGGGGDEGGRPDVHVMGCRLDVDLAAILEELGAVLRDESGAPRYPALHPGEHVLVLDLGGDDQGLEVWDPAGRTVVGPVVVEGDEEGRLRKAREAIQRSLADLQ